jgi:hypothetical protein
VLLLCIGLLDEVQNSAKKVVNLSTLSKTQRINDDGLLPLLYILEPSDVSSSTGETFQGLTLPSETGIQCVKSFSLLEKK